MNADERGCSCRGEKPAPDLILDLTRGRSPVSPPHEGRTLNRRGAEDVESGPQMNTDKRR
jgi:hypothetical protein